MFRGFLKTEFSDENIEFWLECEDYKFTCKDIKRQSKSKKIYSDFVAIGSPREVNLEIEIRTQTAQNILNPSHDTFDRAQKRIQALMEKDSYPRFLESDLYKNLLASYPPMPNEQQQQQQQKQPTQSTSSSSSSSNNQLPSPTSKPATFNLTTIPSPTTSTENLKKASSKKSSSNDPSSSSSNENNSKK